MKTEPTALPLLPKESREFLEGSIEAEDYLAARRAEARAQALSEVEADNQHKASPLEWTATTIVFLANLTLGIASFANSDQMLGAVALVTAFALVGVFGARLYRLQHTNSHTEGRPASLFHN
ncbi:hypothetical protein [Micromonospora chalcea]|uniref:hypothetical protein n=1 Tax=Micromonospora chalcea TaxID=1874 RepID=UPI0033CFFDBD